MLKCYSSETIEYIVDDVSLKATQIDPSSVPSGQPTFSSSPSISSHPTFISKNLSWHKPTWQSSTLNGRNSDFAVDGEKDTHTYTKNGINSWEVDLESVAIITNIKIFQR